MHTVSVSVIDLSSKANHIRNLWKGCVRSFIEIGKELTQAKELVDHGQFNAWVEHELPFGLRTAERLLKISENAVLANPTRASFLPPHWPTLYELSRLPEAALAKAIEDDVVTARMERTDAVKLVTQLCPKGPGHPRSNRQKHEMAERVLRLLVGVRARVEKVNVLDLSPEQRAAWEDEVGSTIVSLERKQDELKAAVGEVVKTTRSHRRHHLPRPPAGATP